MRNKINVLVTKLEFNEGDHKDDERQNEQLGRSCLRKQSINGD